MKYKYLVATALIGSCTFLGSCMEEFAEINTNPTVVSKPDPRYLFTQALSVFEGNDYFTWFYDYTNLQRWSQTAVNAGGNENTVTTMTKTGNMGGQVYNVMNPVNELIYIINTTMSGEEQAKYASLKALCQPLMIYLAMLDTDMCGAMAYSEAYQGRYTNPPLLTPKYDTQEELFELWETQLKEAVKTLSDDSSTQQSLGAQDLIYKGDYTLWLKFANSLRLKLAARLINVDKARALAIVKDVSNYPIMTELGDDFIYNKGIYERHFAGGNDMNRDVASKQLIDFMVGHQDPRVRVFFEKNDYNSRVVQAFLTAGQDLPSFIADKIITEVKDGKTVFKDWKAPGEPWVRYHGIPSFVDAGSTDLHPEYADYFDKAKQLWVTSGKTFNPTSRVNQYMFDKKVAIEYPDLPGETEPEKNLYAWFGLYLSAAEVNLYLAEFKLLSKGEDIGFPESAESYLKKGVELSVRAYDKVAGLNHIPYYDDTYSKDLFDESIKLQEAEVTKLKNDPILTLNGTDLENLEKIYLQQYIHFALMPADQYAMMRRSGCPIENSSLYPMEKMYPNAASFPLPRRFQITPPTADDRMGDIKRKAYLDQGFSYGPDPATLNRERVWYDKQAPQFGAGPKMN